MNDEGLMTPAQRAAIQYAAQWHGIQRPSRWIYIWSKRRWVWCDPIVDIGRRPDFTPWRNKPPVSEPLAGDQRKNNPGGKPPVRKIGPTTRSILDILAEQKQATTAQIAKWIGKPVDATYNALTRKPELFEKLNPEATHGQVSVWKLRDGKKPVGNGREHTECGRAETLHAPAPVVGDMHHEAVHGVPATNGTGKGNHLARRNGSV